LARWLLDVLQEEAMSRWIGTIAVLACAAQLQAQTPDASASPTYMNAEVVRVDASGRTLTFRGTSGQSVITAEGDAVASLSGLKAGDQVILTYRDAPAAKDRRLTGIRPVTETRSAPAAPVAAAPAPATAAVPRPSPGAFDGAASAAATTAGQVDRAWANYRQVCVKGTQPVTTRGREWFAMLDGSMPRPTDDTCGKSYDVVAAVAKDFKAQVDKLRATATEAGVLPGDLRDTLQRYNIDL
jgi:hypothetical protein